MAKAVDPAFATALSFDVFQQYLQTFLGHAVNADFASDLYAVLQQEAWAMSHLQRLHHKWKPQASIEEMQLDKGETWFLEHLLTSCLTGIYYYADDQQMLTYRHALMYEAFVDLRPIPAYSTRDFGFWQHAPKEP